MNTTRTPLERPFAVYCQECECPETDLFRKGDLYVCCTCKYGDGLTKRSERDPMIEALTDILAILEQER